MNEGKYVMTEINCGNLTDFIHLFNQLPQRTGMSKINSLFIHWMFLASNLPRSNGGKSLLLIILTKSNTRITVIDVLKSCDFWLEGESEDHEKNDRSTVHYLYCGPFRSVQRRWR